MTYIIGDLHGCLDAWLELKNRIESKDTDAKFILIGDIIDRGPKVVELCDWALENISNFGKYQMIMGNHEHDKIINFDCNMKSTNNSLEDIKKWWKDEVSYDWDDHYCSVRLFDTFDHYNKVIDFFRTLRYYIDLNINNQRFIVVHANIPYTAIEKDGITLKKNSELTERDKEIMVWSRDTDDFTKISDTIIVTGHNPTLCASLFPYDCKPGKVYKTPHRYNIDCGVVFRSTEDVSNLAALCLDTQEVIYLYN